MGLFQRFKKDDMVLPVAHPSTGGPMGSGKGFSLPSFVAQFPKVHSTPNIPSFP